MFWKFSFKKVWNVWSHIAPWKMSTRTHFARTFRDRLPHALLHAHRTCRSAILRTCAPQPNVCLSVSQLVSSNQHQIHETSYWHSNHSAKRESTNSRDQTFNTKAFMMIDRVCSSWNTTNVKLSIHQALQASGIFRPLYSFQTLTNGMKFLWESYASQLAPSQFLGQQYWLWHLFHFVKTNRFHTPFFFLLPTAGCACLRLLSQWGQILFENRMKKSQVYR